MMDDKPVYELRRIWTTMELNLFLLPEMWTIPYWMALHPSRQIMDRNSPRLSKMLSIPSTALVVWNSALKTV